MKDSQLVAFVVCDAMPSSKASKDSAVFALREPKTVILIVFFTLSTPEIEVFKETSASRLISVLCRGVVTLPVPLLNVITPVGVMLHVI